MSPLPREGDNGRELDARISAEVMGVVWDETRCRVCGWPLAADVDGGCVPGNCAMRGIRVEGQRRADEPAHYSTRIECAWMVVEKLREMRKAEDALKAVFSLAHCYTASQVAEAICRAALSSLSNSDETPK